MRTPATLIEWLVIAAIVGIVLSIVMGGFNLDSPEKLCAWRGGVPITDRDGRLIRCDFPLTIYR